MTNHPNRGRKPRPRMHLEEIARRYPGAWLQVDSFRADRGVDLPEWPDWCFLPIAGYYAIVSGGGESRIGERGRIADVGRLAALGAWRVTQGIYRFDPALYTALVETPVSGDLPHEVLHRMPEWCVYLETPDLEWGGAQLHGAFAHLEWDANTGREELRFVMDTSAGLEPVILHLGKWTIDEAVDRMVAEAKRNANAAQSDAIDARPLGVRESIEPVVSLLLYVCSANADLEQPPQPQPKRTKTGWRLFPADKPTVWPVGERIGAALRRAYHQRETGQQEIDPETGRARPRPHVRRAHWHTFLARPKRSERRLRWLPPIPVSMDDPGDLAPTVRPVKGSDDGSS